MELLFWILLGLLFYTYIGYGMLIAVLAKAGQFLKKSQPKQYIKNDPGLPNVCLLVAAYNEEDFIQQKIENCFEQDYPKDKLTYFFVSDGSNDRTAEIIKRFSEIKAFHKNERKGKIAAVQRVMPFVNSEIVVFTDANTLLNRDAVFNLLRHFKENKIGAVAGEKRIQIESSMGASAAGEGIYWKYESLIKKWESLFHTVVGAAGELFAIRAELYEAVENDTLVEDFHMTINIAAKGHSVVYDSEAYAIEGPSNDISEEFKRKKRIAAGGWQAAYRLRKLLNPFRYGLLSFQYFSHRVLRWTIAPLCLPLLLLVNIHLALTGSIYFQVLLFLQCLFYLLAIVGWLAEQNKMKFKVFFVPFYFCFMNFAVFAGLYSLLKGEQSVVWEKANRKK
ncbi:MAG: glycosyltransferase family 2 protein [Chitinophagales bacterium]